MLSVHTIGHSTRSLDEFVGLLHEANVNTLVDVRSIPKSRTVPHFNSDVLPASLAGHAIAYRHMLSLGGRRHHAKGAPPSAHTYWKVEAFRNYADYAETPAFQGGLDELIALASETRCAIMCAEAVWWRCHRRIVADYLLSRGLAVLHILGAGNVVPATLTPGAQLRDDGTILYAKEPQLL